MLHLHSTSGIGGYNSSVSISGSRTTTLFSSAAWAALRPCGRSVPPAWRPGPLRPSTSALPHPLGLGSSGGMPEQRPFFAGRPNLVGGRSQAGQQRWQQGQGSRDPAAVSTEQLREQQSFDPRHELQQEGGMKAGSPMQQNGTHGEADPQYSSGDESKEAAFNAAYNIETMEETGGRSGQGSSPLEAQDGGLVGTAGGPLYKTTFEVRAVALLLWCACMIHIHTHSLSHTHITGSEAGPQRPLAPGPHPAAGPAAGVQAAATTHTHTHSPHTLSLTHTHITGFAVGSQRPLAPGPHPAARPAAGVQAAAA
jgi:hypothetical protein